jgi:hypothetical protein
MTNTRYLDYLNSDGWYTKREMVLQRDGFTCQWCGYDSELQVHHLHYDNIFREELEDLVTLCSECHEEADIEREEARDREIYENQLDGWASKVWPKYWPEAPSHEMAEMKFRRWLRRKGETPLVDPLYYDADPFYHD